jgi:phosphatidylinositol glycan class K
VLLTDFFGNVQNIELTESSEKGSLQTEDIDPIEEAEPIALDTTENENDTLAAQQPPQLPQGHTFEIGDPTQSQTWRYVVFVALSVTLFGALATSSFIL